MSPNERAAQSAMCLEASPRLRNVEKRITLFDTNDRFDAGWLGYDGPVDPTEDGEGLVITADKLGSSVRVNINAPDGEIIGEKAIRATIEALQSALAFAQAKRAA